MGWMTTATQIEHMLAGCKGRGWPDFDLWWRDESRLETWWAGKGWPVEAQAGVGAVPCGAQFVAWCGRYPGNLWAVLAFGPIGPDEWREWGAPHPETVTLFNAREHGGPPKRGEFTPGGWVGYHMKGEKTCRLARCETVLPTGGIATAWLAPDVEATGVSGLGLKFFPIIERDAACEDFWRHKHTAWKHYLVMRGAMYARQHKMTGIKPGGHPPQSTVPGTPKRVWTTESPQAATAAPKPRPAPRDLASEVQRLKEGYVRAEAAFEQVNAAMLATAEGTPEAERAMALQNAAEQAMAEAWDAWDAAEKQWIAELMD